MRIGKWTITDVVQGKPIGHPSHPLFVHFPTALYPMAFLLHLLGEPRAARLALAAGVLAGLAAAATGLVDWARMVPGSTKRRFATKHMWIQLAGQAVAVVALAVWTPLSGAAFLIVSVGNWFGGHLVYRMAMRVGGKMEPTPPRS